MTGSIIGWGKIWVAIRFMKGWKIINIVLGRKAVIWPLFGWRVYYPFFVVMTEVRDVRTVIRVHHRAVKTPMINLHLSLPKCNVTTTLRSVLKVFWLHIPLKTSCSSEKAAPQFSISNTGFDHAGRISLILLHSFPKCLITLSFWTSLESRKSYSICIQLVMAIGLHPHKTILHPLPA